MAAVRDSLPSQTFSYQQVMIRVVSPQPAVNFFSDHFDMQLIDVKRFPDAEFDLYFLASLPEGEASPTPGTPEASRLLWSYPRCTIELTHNYGTESRTDKVYYTGNERSDDGKETRGFCHISLAVDDAAAKAAQLEAAGVKFEQRLLPGADYFSVLEPTTGYTIRVVQRIAGAPATEVRGKPCLLDAQLRVRNVKASVDFYGKHFGMSLVAQYKDAAQGALLASCATFADKTALPADASSSEALAFARSLSGSMVTFAQMDDAPADITYCNGNVDPGRGFGHIGFLVDNLEEKCVELEAMGVAFKKRPHEGRMRGLAFAVDLDGYWIEIIQRGKE